MAIKDHLESEEEFLKDYDKTRFDSPILSIDAALFTFHEEKIKILLVKRASHPERGRWGLPGGFVDCEVDQTLEHTVLRKLREKTGVNPPYLDQLRSYGNATRDPRGWSVTVCYSALIAHQNCQPHIDTVSDSEWVDVSIVNTLELAFDHAVIIEDARLRLKQKALYSIIPAYALSEEFTLPELQTLHELLIGKSLQKKSFRRRIEQAELLIEVGERKAASGRPAKLYRMKENTARFTFIRNLEA